jgi:hypothetical protein
MAEISFGLIHRDDQKKAPLYLEQIEAIIDVSGARPDPLTLQQIRDEQSIKDCFTDRRKNLHELIVDYAGRIKKAKDQKAAQTLVKEFNATLMKDVEQFEKELQKRVDAFTVKQKKDVNDLFWARAKLVCRVVYAAAKLVADGLETVAKVAAAVAGPGVFVSVVAIKSLISSVSDLKDAYGEVVSAMEGERAQYAKLEAAVKKLKAVKAPKPVDKGDIDAVEAMLGPYGARLLGVDSAAKATASKLDKYLSDMEKGKFRDKQAQATAEKMVDQAIQRIIELSKNLDQGRKLVQSARSKIADASKRAKVAPASWWDYAPSLWKVFDTIVDIREETMDVTGLKATFSKCVEVLQDKLEDEMQDALVEEHTKA